MASVILEQISKRYGATLALDRVNLDIEDGEFMTLVGPSGCGKSTLLRVIAGLDHGYEGQVQIGGRVVDGLRPRARNIAMVFQNYALYPHMTVAANIGTPLRLDRLGVLERLPMIRSLMPGRRQKVAVISDQVRAVASQLEIDHLLTRMPSQLSGGQRQRVALGRAMVRDPHVFLMDEPLSNLDAALRVQMRGELTDLHRRLGTTFVYVTHDQVEAMTMSTRVAVMADGEILQVGPPEQLYDQPDDIRVARFIGSPAINELGVPVDIRHRFGLADAEHLTLAIRPEALELAVAGVQALCSARVERIENLGAEVLIHLQSEEGGAVVMRRSAAEHAAWRESGCLSDTLRLSAPLSALHLFGPDGRRRPLPDAVAA